MKFNACVKVDVVAWIVALPKEMPVGVMESIVIEVEAECKGL